MKRRVRWIACSAALVLGASAFWQGLQVTRDCVYSDKVSRIVRFAVVTDLHSTWYGEAQSGLIDAITREDPDAVLLAGDIVDDERPRDAAKAFLQAVTQKYPTYCVLGNHEFRIPAPEEVKDWARDLGVTVLDGTGETVTLNDETVRICGVDDPACGTLSWQSQFDTVCRMAQDTDTYTILLSHRPERTNEYTNSPFDLVVSGHAHGGQVRIPLLLPGGLIAPGQGLFPAYTSGLHELEGTTLLVSRGLCRNGIPRVFNRPELVIIDVTPKNAYTGT